MAWNKSDDTLEFRTANSDNNGFEYVGIKAPASIGASYTLTLPSAQGSSNTFMKTDGNGTLSWTNAIDNSQNVRVLNTTNSDNYDILFCEMGTSTNSFKIIRSINEGSGNKRLTYNPNSGTLSTENIYNTSLKIGRNSTDLIDFSTDNKVTFRVNNYDTFGMIQTGISSTGHVHAFYPNDPVRGDLGRLTTQVNNCWRGLYLNDTGFIKFKRNNTTGHITALHIAHTTDKLTVEAANYTQDVTLKTVGHIEATNSLKLIEGDDEDGEYVGFQAPASIGTSYTLTLPAATGSANQVLKTDGSGNLSWTGIGGATGDFSSDVTITGAALILDNTYNDFNLKIAQGGDGTSHSQLLSDNNIELITQGNGFIDGGTHVTPISGTNYQATRHNIAIGHTSLNTHEQSSGRFNVMVGNGIAYNTVDSEHYVGLYNAFYGHESGRVFGLNGNSSDPPTIDSNDIRYNSIFGARSGYSLTLGSGNTIMGYFAGKSIVDSHNNTIIGREAGYNITSTSNVLVGAYAGYYLGAAANVICIGRQTGPGSSDQGTNQLLKGNSGNYQVYIDTTSSYNGEDSLIWGDQSQSSQYNLTVNGVLHLQNKGQDGSTNTSGTGEIRLYDDDGCQAMGGNYASIKAPASITTSYTLTLPSDDGTDGYVLKTNGSGTLSWIDSVPRAEKVKITNSNSNTNFNLALTSNIASTHGNSASNANLLQAASDGKQIYYSPHTGTLSTENIYNTSLKIGRDSTDLIDFSTDNKVTFRVNNAGTFAFINDSTSKRISPLNHNGADLGRAQNSWRGLYMGESGFITFRRATSSTDRVHLTYSTDKLTFDSDHSNDITFKTVGHIEATKSLKLIEGGDEDGECVGFQAPASIGASYTVTLPDAQGGNNTFMKNDGSGNLSWSSQAYSSQYVVPISTTSLNTTDYDVTFVSMGSNSSTTTNLRAVNNTSGNKRLTYNPNTGTLTSTLFSGGGGSLTNLNASNISAGTVSDANLPNYITTNIAGTTDRVNVYTGSLDHNYHVPFVHGTGNHQMTNAYGATGGDGERIAIAGSEENRLYFNPSSGLLRTPHLDVTSTGSVGASIRLYDDDHDTDSAPEYINIEAPSEQLDGSWDWRLPDRGGHGGAASGISRLQGTDVAAAPVTSTHALASMDDPCILVHQASVQGDSVKDGWLSVKNIPGIDPTARGAVIVGMGHSYGVSNYGNLHIESTTGNDTTWRPFPEDYKWHDMIHSSTTPRGTNYGIKCKWPGHMRSAVVVLNMAPSYMTTTGSNSVDNIIVRCGYSTSNTNTSGPTFQGSTHTNTAHDAMRVVQHINVRSTGGAVREAGATTVMFEMSSAYWNAGSDIYFKFQVKSSLSNELYILHSVCPSSCIVYAVPT